MNKPSRKRYRIADRRRLRLPLAVHTGCWKLLQWQLGPSVIHNLKLFAAIMLNISIENPPRLRREHMIVIGLTAHSKSNKS